MTRLSFLNFVDMPSVDAGGTCVPVQPEKDAENFAEEFNSWCKDSRGVNGV